MKHCLFLCLLVFAPFKLQAQISRVQLTLIQEAFQSEYGAELAANQAAMTINKDTPASPDMWWNLDTIHASYVTIRENGIRQHNLYVFGGYARLPGMTVDGVLAVLCHELGHGIGGAPYKDNGEKEFVSVEGQSDYFAYASCLPRMMKRVPPAKTPQAVSAKAEAICQGRSKSPSELLNCYRVFEALEIERMYFAKYIGSPSQTDYDTPDMQEIDRINLDPYYYPSNQCRLDTMLRGFFHEARPACWYVEP